MAEYIKREDALDAVLFSLVGTGHQSQAIYAIRDVPTADVVEVVRCKDCVFCVKTQGACIWCRLNDCRFDKDGFCSYGERRSNENNA